MSNPLLLEATGLARLAVAWAGERGAGAERYCAYPRGAQVPPNGAERVHLCTMANVTVPSAEQRNVLGEPLEPCGTDPVTGFYRDGCCLTGPEDVGSHTVCAVVTGEFLAYQREVGNDLTTPVPAYGFPGLVPGDRWCVVAVRWLQAYQAGVAAPVVLRSTHEAALDLVPLSALRAHAVDVPTDAAGLE